jgi:hypothetical protein
MNLSKAIALRQNGLIFSLQTVIVNERVVITLGEAL